MQYYFERFTFDTERTRLVQFGRTVPLEKNASRILCHLLENHGRIIPTQELIQVCEEDDLSSEAALPRQIEEIRKALGDDEIITHLTHPREGEGYHFAATVTQHLKDRPGSGTLTTLPVPRNAGEDGLWKLFQNARSHLRRYNRDDRDEAFKLFNEALQADPTFGPAHSGMSLALSHSALMGWTETPEAAIELAHRHAEEALRLDPEDAFAHFCMGRVYTLLGAYEPAITALQLSRTLNPAFALAHFGLGFTKLWFGMPKEAIGDVREAIRLCPDYPSIWAFQTILGAAYWLTGENEEADRLLTTARQARSADFWPSAKAIAVSTELGEHDRAQEALQEMKCKRPGITLAHVDELLAHASERLREPLLSGLRTAGFR